MDARNLSHRVLRSVTRKAYSSTPGDIIYEWGLLVACRGWLIERARVRRLRDQLDAVDGPFDETELRRKPWNLVCEWEGYESDHPDGLVYAECLEEAAEQLKEVLDAAQG